MCPSGVFDITDDGKHLVILPDKGENSMVYFAPLKELLSTGRLQSKLKIIPVVERLDHEYSVSRCHHKS